MQSYFFLNSIRYKNAYLKGNSLWFLWDNRVYQTLSVLTWYSRKKKWLKELPQPSILGSKVRLYRLWNMCATLALCSIQHSEARSLQGKYLGLWDNFKGVCFQAWIYLSIPTTATLQKPSYLQHAAGQRCK